VHRRDVFALPAVQDLLIGRLPLRGEGDESLGGRRAALSTAAMRRSVTSRFMKNIRFPRGARDKWGAAPAAWGEVDRHAIGPWS
jgi:hypothetical protein